MTRFNITLNEVLIWLCGRLKIWKWRNICTKNSSYNILDLVKAFNSNPKIKKIGIRPGEKLDEEMISINESINTIDLGNYYAILNEFAKNSKKYKRAKYVKKDFSYNSKTNPDFLSVYDLKKIIKSEL